MTVKKKRKRSFLVCTKCSKEKPLKREKLVITKALLTPKKEIVIMKKGDEAIDLPKTRVICPKCENREAYWWMQQTRSADETPTQFFKCTQCKHVWREYR